MTATRKLVNPAEQQRVGLRVYTALDMMANGTASIDEWRDLSDGINIMEALCDLGKVDAGEHGVKILEAIDGMAEAIEGFGHIGRMRMSDRSLDALKAVIEQYVLANARFSQSTLVAAQAHVVVKVAGARNNPDSSVRIVSP